MRRIAVVSLKRIQVGFFRDRLLRWRTNDGGLASLDIYANPCSSYGFRFKNEWLDRVSSLVKGDRIVTVRRLKTLEPMGLILSKCEFSV
jgi:hypothetical protein